MRVQGALSQIARWVCKKIGNEPIKFWFAYKQSPLCYFFYDQEDNGYDDLDEYPNWNILHNNESKYYLFYGRPINQYIDISYKNNEK